MVAARSAVDTPVVQPSTLSMVTVNGVPRRLVFELTCGSSSSSLQRDSVIGAHSTPRPFFNMKLTASDVIFSAAMMKSPSFSRSSSSTTITNLPSLKSSRASSILFNLNLSILCLYSFYKFFLLYCIYCLFCNLFNLYKVLHKPAAEFDGSHVYDYSYWEYNNGEYIEPPFLEW